MCREMLIDSGAAAMLNHQVMPNVRNEDKNKVRSDKSKPHNINNGKNTHYIQIHNVHMYLTV